VLDTVGIPYTFVLEQQEYEAYRHHFPQSPVVVLPESHKGIAYVRNWLLQYAAQQGHTWYWMMDDDIRGFWKVERGEYVPADATVLLGAEKATTWENIVQVSLCTKWKSGPARKDQYVLNTDCSRVVCQQAQILSKFAEYCPDLPLFSDADFTLQALHRGYQTVTWQTYAQYTYFCGSNKGGLHETYRSEDLLLWAEKLRSRWGKDIVKIRKNNVGKLRPDVQWNYFSEGVKRVSGIHPK